MGVFLEAVEREVPILRKYLDFAPDSTGGESPRSLAQELEVGKRGPGRFLWSELGEGPWGDGGSGDVGKETVFA